MNQLNVLCEALDFNNGDLYDVADDPSSFPESIDWLDKGEWLAAAKRAGAEKIFFVNNNPIAVFAQCDTGLKEKIKAFNRAWCLARPRLFFLASPGEITVYDLAQNPIDEHNEKEWKKFKSLDVLYDLENVSRELQAYHRDNVESGRVFADKRFGNLKNRADKSLIRDLKTVRAELIEAGLSGNQVRFAHALIGRSIFIRYLEDRGILTEEYFLDVARQNADWPDLLRNPVNKPGVDFSSHETFYPRILADEAFTYALFRRLAHDFNGDMFPDVDEEERAVTQEHLTLMQDLLYGDVGIQKKLFFYSYHFDIVPLDLISSIYEEFYHVSTSNDKKRGDGAYYTPTVLAEFILSRILTPAVLDKTPRVLDPACGSGIFLVEAFRRIVRYNLYKNKQALSFNELKHILKEQIAGIEINEEAARIAAFSLYLSMLHYLEPPAIDRQIKMGNRLPNLVATTNPSVNHFHCILPGNTFDPEFVRSNPLWRERFGEGCADVIVGNPPWGSPGRDTDAETKARHGILVDWCKRNNKPIGDKEASQAFLWRALDFLKEGGTAGMLVSAGVLFKHNTTTQAFREQWFGFVRLDEVFNFAHVRKFFFKGADAPFLGIFFSKAGQEDNPVNYWSVKQCIVVNKVQSILLSQIDLRVIRRLKLSDYRVWKLFYFNSYKDYEFLDYLANSAQAIPLIDTTLFSCVGFKEGNKQKDADWLSEFRKVRNEAFSRYNNLNDDAFEGVPAKIEHRGRGREIYIGDRIVIKEGPVQTGGCSGRIEARYETEPYAYNHSFHVIKLSDVELQNWKYSVLIGILWSSFARYYLFLTSSSWGLWHDKVLVGERLQLPVVFGEDNYATAKVISIVDKLRNSHQQERDVFNPDGMPEKEIQDRRREWEVELDEAVFELYGLNEQERDLVRDFCEVTLPFFYQPFNSIGTEKAVEDSGPAWIEKYVHTFCKRWNVYLGEDEEMRAEVHVGAHGNMVALEFFPSDKGDPWDLGPKDDTWSDVLEQIGNTLPRPMGTSQILLDGLVHIVSDSGIIIVKRNEKRFWTRSLAREDADTAICKRMMEAVPEEGRNS